MSTPEASPLTQEIDADVHSISVTPVFGNRLKIRINRGVCSFVDVPGSMAAVTIHGDGRIEYHPDPLEPTPGTPPQTVPAPRP